MTRRSRATIAASTWLALAAIAGHLGCATEEQAAAQDDDTTTGRELTGLGGNNNAGGRVAISAGATPRTGGTSATQGGTGGAADNGGGHDTGGSAGQAGRTNGSAGSAGGSAGYTNGGAGNAGSAGQAGGPNQPAMCDEATATVLSTMSSNVTVASNVCLKMTLPADQTWIKKITMQPEGGMYPLPFSWSNCGTNSSGAFNANYANSILDPVTPQCPILVELGGNGSPVNVQWWGG